MGRECLLFHCRQTNITENHEYCTLSVCLSLSVAQVKTQHAKTDWVPGKRARGAQPHRFITSWQSCALQGTAVGGNALGLLINILSPPFLYTQVWHRGWSVPELRTNCLTEPGTEKLQGKKKICVVKEKK